MRAARRYLTPPWSTIERAYLQIGSPSLPEPSGVVVFIAMPHSCVAGSCVWFTVPDHQPGPASSLGGFTPVELWNFRSVSVCVYLELSEKNASSAVTRLRRSDFIAVTYALPFVLANFGIAIAARIPM